MRAIITNTTNHILVSFNDTYQELKTLHEVSGGAFPPIYRDIDSSKPRYSKACIERWNLSDDGSYIEVHFVSGHKIQMSHYIFEDYKNDLDNSSLLNYIDSILIV